MVISGGSGGAVSGEKDEDFSGSDGGGAPTPASGRDGEVLDERAAVFGGAAGSTFSFWVISDLETRFPSGDSADAAGAGALPLFVSAFAVNLETRFPSGGDFGAGVGDSASLTDGSSAKSF